MSGVGYDFLEGIHRMLKASEHLDQFAVEVITYHAALEAEINLVLGRMVPRGEKVVNGPLGLNHKVTILNAAWPGKGEDADKICAVLVAFIDLRNAVAHPDQKRVQTRLQNLRTAYREIDAEAGEETGVLEIAQGICAFLGDGPTPTTLHEIFDGLGNLFGKVGTESGVSGEG